MSAKEHGEGDVCDPLTERVRGLLPQYEIDERDAGYWARVAGLPKDECRDEAERAAWLIADGELAIEG